jgi:hypothetical protein
MGHVIAGGGSFAIEVEPLAESEQGAFSAMVYAAIVKFKASPLSASQLADELKHMVDDHWDWQVCKLTESEYSVIFPTQATLRMGTRSGKLFLPLNKVEVSIREAFLDPKPSVVLPSTWVQISGLPGSMMEEERLMAAMVMLGRPLEVDLLSLRKYKTEPIRMKFQCLFPEKIRGTVQLVVNGEGFSLDVQAELGARGGAGGAGNPPRPPPPGDDSPDEDDYDDLSPDEEEWRRLGRKDADKEREKSKETAKGKQAPTAKDKGVSRDGGSHSALVSSRLGLDSNLDEYGSNLGGNQPIALLLDSQLSPGGAVGEVSMEDSQLTELPMGTPKKLSAQITAESGLEVCEGAGAMEQGRVLSTFRLKQGRWPSRPRARDPRRCTQGRKVRAGRHARARG